MWAATKIRLSLCEKPASGGGRVEVDGDDDLHETYFMPTGGATSAMGQGLPLC